MASYYNNKPALTTWQRPQTQSYKRFGLAAPQSSQPYQSVQPYKSAYETFDQINQGYNQQPLNYSSLSGGRTLATRSYNPGAMPNEMSGTRFEHLYSGGMTNRFILPDQSGVSQFTQRQAPTSDLQRQQGFNMGINGQNQMEATQSRNYFSDSDLKPPTYTNQWGEEVPIYGATIDYTTGQYYLPPDRYFPRYFGKLQPNSRRTGLRSSDAQQRAKQPSSTERKWLRFQNDRKEDYQRSILEEFGYL